MKNIKKIILLGSFVLSGCSVMIVDAGPIYKNNYKIRSERPFPGLCGGVVFLGPIFLPIIPWPYFNSCNTEGLALSYKNNDGYIYKLKYNGEIYQSNIYGSPKAHRVKVDMKELREARDAAVLVEKDGIIIREIPFDWVLHLEYPVLFD